MLRIDTSELENKLSLLIDRVSYLTDEIEKLKPEREQVEAYSIARVAQKLSCSKGKVRNLFVSGELAGYQEKKGGKIFIYPEAVDMYIRNKAC